MTSLENHEQNVEYSGEKLTYGKTEIEWRRAKVLELSSQGYNQHQVAAKLQIAKGTVNGDLAHLRRQAYENIQKHIHEAVPEEYQKCMVGMKRNLKHVLEIGEAASDPKTKLEARRIANDCYKIIMDLCSNASVIEQALKLVQQKTEQLDKIQTIRMVEERIQASEKETTTEGAY